MGFPFCDNPECRANKIYVEDRDVPLRILSSVPFKYQELRNFKYMDERHGVVYRFCSVCASAIKMVERS